ncbi:MAG: hypothetical protein VX619_00845 [bacterium]|nr:hypothetical protein [bacterium]
MTQKPRSDVKPRDLFSIDKNETSITPREEITDTDDYFDISSNPFTEDTDEEGWVDDRKIFGEEDDPTVIEDKPKKEDKPAKKLDSKTLSKLKAKKRTGPSPIINLFTGIQSFVLLCIVSLAPVYVAYNLKDKLYLQIFLVLPLILLFFWPFMRNKGFTLNVIFKISNLWYCGAIVYLLFLTKKAGLAPSIINQHWNGFLIQIDYWLLFHLYFAFFCQSLIFYLWRSNVNWLLKVTPILLLAYSLVELLIQIKTTSTIFNLGNDQNVITTFFKPFIGDFGLYLSPHFILTHAFLPLTIVILTFASFLLLIQKKWSQAISSLLYSLQGVIFISIYLMPYRNEDISSRILSLGPIIDRIIKLIFESIPIII